MPVELPGTYVTPSGQDITGRSLTISATSPYTPSSVADTINNVIYVDAAYDNVTDDTAAWIAAVAKAAAAGGGDIWATGKGPGKMTSLVTSVVLIQSSNIRIHFAVGVTVNFVPIPPIIGGTNDRCFYIQGVSSAVRPVTGAINIGDNSFVATNAGDVTDLTAGAWIVLREDDTGAGDTVLEDWVQVLSVAGTTVNTQAPIRVTFPATGGGRTLNFKLITTLVEGIEMDSVAVNVPLNTQQLVPLIARLARRVSYNKCVMNNAWGNAYDAYECNDVLVRGCTALADLTQATEFAAIVGLVITGCNFGTVGSATTGQARPNNSALNVDFGTCFFTITGNRIGPTGNIAVQLNAVHDGCYVGNTHDWVRDAGIGVGQGISGKGCLRIIVEGNVLIGGDAGGGNQGIAFGNTTTYSVNINSADNSIGPNIITNFGTTTGGGVTDTILDRSGGKFTFKNALVISTGGLKVAGGIGLDSGTPSTNHISGASGWTLQVNDIDRVIFHPTEANLAQFSFVGGNVGSVTAATNTFQINGQTLTLTGSYAEQRGVEIGVQTLNGAFTVTDATTVKIDGGPAGTATKTRKYQLWLAGTDQIRVDTTTSATIGAAGAAAALPANPLGYLPIFVGTTTVKVPYYNP